MKTHKLLIILIAFFLFLIILSAFFLNACGDNKIAASSTMGRSATGKIKSKQLNELSGIVPAKGREEYWGHNDKGNDEEIFRFNSKGKILQEVELKGVKNDDWEGMTIDSNRNLYIADTGDKELRRKSYRIYQFTEPKTSTKKIKKINSYKFNYADGKPHNCEAIFAMNDRLYIITKEQEEKQKIFCIDKLKKKQTISAREVGRLDISGQVTDVAYSSKHKQLAVLTDKKIAFYHVAKESDLFRPPVHFTHIRFDRCEALCYDENHLVVTNESGDIWRYPLEFFLKK
ncbi:hypothetical protein H8E77_20580 [bacterium]|nr:hypothetical protein [bacterium]